MVGTSGVVHALRGVGVALVFAMSATQVKAQDCQAVLQQLLSGGADVGWGENAADYYNRNCLGGHSRPPPAFPPVLPEYNPPPTYQEAAPTPPTYQEPAPSFVPNAVLQEFSVLGQLTNKGEPLPQAIPLSSGTKMMEFVTAPPPVPQDYADPFASSSFPPITESTSGPVTQRGSVWDPSQWVNLSPPARPSTAAQPAPTAGACGRYGELCSGPVTGFDGPTGIRPLPK